MSRTPEGIVKDAIKKWLRTLPHCWFFSPAGTVYSAGIPDLIVCYKGVFVGIEVKAPGKLTSGVTALQREQIRLINMAMGYAVAVDSLELVRTLFLDIDLRLGLTRSA